MNTSLIHSLRTEEEIIAHWKGNINKPVVSICCITYNHDQYIEDAIKGFLIQETEFPFEILIHDDASTDRTAEIIQKYQSKYPFLIKPICQTVNQYTTKQNGVKMNPTFNFTRSKGEYLALCEGDDYWTNSTKLQKQLNLMHKYPDINISFHPAYQMKLHSLNNHKKYSDYGSKAKVFSLEEAILGGGGFMPTASLMIKKSTMTTLPRWFYETAPVGDLFIQVIAAHPYGALYIPDTLSVYRTCTPNSWTSSRNKISFHKLTRDAEAFKCSLIHLREKYPTHEKAINFALARELIFCSWLAIKNSYFRLSINLLLDSLAHLRNVNIFQLIFKAATHKLGSAN